ncbi:MAG TPA: hypothetical protein VHC73_13630, partial [Vitreimonas sp.]|nr:hypothetical protein [Vitreimonas sp.]
QAWDDFDAVVNHDSDDSWARYGRGIAALRLGRADEGHADLAAAIAKEGDLAQTYGRYGIAAN